MFSDARAVPDNSTVEADICIIGGGVAGITLALSLAGRSQRVVMLESGGFEFEPDIQDLSIGDIVGRDYYDLDVTRLRYFGGTSNHWGGCCTLLSPIDFEQRPWVPFSGWPITRADLDPYYERAHALCEIGPVNYDGDYWAERHDRPMMRQHLSRFLSSSRQFGPPTRFGEVYRDTLERAGNVNVVLNGSVTELVLDQSGNLLSELKVKTLEGGEFTAKAGRYVLACGGIENARILLASNRQERGGVGNRNDLVGRFFMDHLSVWSGAFWANDPDALLSFSQQRPDDGFDVDGVLTLGEASQREEEILNICVELLPETEAKFPQSRAIGSTKAIARALKYGVLPDRFGEHVGNILFDLDSIRSAAAQKLLGGSGGDAQTVRALLPGISMEQAPNPDSRVMLSEERDALGINRVVLDWRLSELDLRSYRRGLELLGAEMAQAGLGRLQLETPDTADGWPELFYGHHHHMGTTRMHDDPKQGVVDRNCRVHGIGNLYIAGSSVFPTGGYSWPTVNIVALTLRLADHLTEDMQ
jgi:choline dehydrogenase-like flavoprotein